MTIQLDWFGCDPRPAWENGIHKILEDLQRLKKITHANVRIRGSRDSSPPFELALYLAMPGPDIESSGTGQTFEEALLKASSTARRTLLARSQKARRPTAATRGVKASFRG